MAYELKPGQGSLFKNDRRGSETSPDYKGSVVGPDGTKYWLNGFKKTSKAGQVYLSLSMKAKDGRRDEVPG